ncbi:MAG TPA: penicillin-binding protein 1C [Ramlibacter sp.]|jgi:penicillin-binding protein 1C|uniref:penicillin-binding protein 1C n=1 Tax=Ramlibacter sp. TaxID=1917967 RepID=UPI002D544189|nr:penicillin-binding protein 1C [Ramlibacter sp.]HZY17809.1 penicillin-binding protein 1C [Ramlibacter sp.]
MQRIAAVLLAFCAGAAWALPAFDEVKQAHRPSDIQVLDRHGELLHRLRRDDQVRRGEWVALEDVSPALRLAMVVSEDRRFWEHRGVDWRAVSSAAWGRLWHQRTRGASTITMQLAGLLDDDWKPGAGGRTVPQKLGQAAAAQVLERRWRKDQVLEAYLNLVPFRGEVVGIDALSRTLFGKAPHGLDAQEAAIAAALVRAPNAAAGMVARRACGLLRDMGEVADCIGLDLMTTGAFQRRAFAASEGIAPHLARRAVAVSGGQARIVTTLRADVQRVALEALQQQLRELRRRHVEDGAMLVLDNASGDVLAWVGSSGTLSQAAEVDGVTALRQAGSTLKPFLYAQAIAERRLTAASLLDDAPAHIPTASGLYIPQNYDHHFKGMVSVRTALASSLNVPAVRALVTVSPHAFHRQLRDAGLPLKDTGDWYGYSLALGSADVPLLQLANAYRTLANGGRVSDVRWLASQARAPMRPAFDPAAAFIVGDILSDPNARARTFGTDSILATRFWTAVKTGTSKDMRDNWAVGWSQRYTVGVWVGNASGAAMHDVSGTSGAAPAWAAVMRHLHSREPSRVPVPPAGVVQAAVRFEGGLEAPRGEWFMAGTQQALVRLDGDAPAAEAAPRILSPADGTIVALDPDIPANRQRVALRSTAARGVRWQLDGREFAQGTDAGWLPWPGRHRLRLVAADGRTLDEVQVEVRGAGLRPAPGKTKAADSPLPANRQPGRADLPAR